MHHKSRKQYLQAHTKAKAVYKADLEVQNYLIAVVSREVLLHVGTGGAAQRVKATVCVDINDDRHCGCVSHQR